MDRPHLALPGIGGLLLIGSVLGAGATGCSGSGAAGTPDAASPDAGSPATLESALGDRCTTDADCRGGICQVSSFGARPFCTVACDFRNDICHLPEPGSGGVGRYFTGFRCIEMPGDFQGTLGRFCLPECTDATSCADFDAGFDRCEEPSWRNNPTVGYTRGSFRICAQPPRTTGSPVDPVRCDWTDKVTSPAIARGVCLDYCTYLDACKELPEDLSRNCCGWGCFLWLTPDGDLDLARKARLQCFVNAFKGAKGSQKVCTAPTETCGLPKIPRP